MITGERQLGGGCQATFFCATLPDSRWQILTFFAAKFLFLTKIAPNTAAGIVQASALWVLWKCRNDICFNRSVWSGMQVIVRKTASILAMWEVLRTDAIKVEIKESMRKLEQAARDPPLILWPDPG